MRFNGYKIQKFKNLKIQKFKNLNVKLLSFLNLIRLFLGSLLLGVVPLAVALGFALLGESLSDFLFLLGIFLFLPGSFLFLFGACSGGSLGPAHFERLNLIIIHISSI